MKGAANGAAVAAAAAAVGGEGERKTINPELWYVCAGSLVNLPPVGSLVVYFPQGHSEQVAASVHKDSDYHVPNYPNLPSKLICLLHNVTLHADSETDEVYAQMTLQPVNTYDKEALQLSELGLKQTRPQTEFFCKTLTASDTSTHGGFSVPRRAAEKIFPPLDFSMQPPAQELQARDLHDNLWTFRHIYRGQPKRHLLTTGWSLFVSGKRLFAGDSVLFIRDEKQQLLLGIRRATRQSSNNTSSVLSSDCMHIGILAAAAHASANNSPFTVFYNPRASPSEFVIPFTKYQKTMYSNQLSLGMRFRMMFETEESGTRRYMGTITGISDLDPVRWKNSQWRNLQVGWDENAAGERRSRVSIWEIEPVAAPFFICPPLFLRKRPRQLGMPDDELSEMENLFKRAMPWLGEEICIKDPQTQSTIMPGLSLVQWMNLQQNPSISNSGMQSEYLRSLPTPVMQNLAATDISRQLGLQAKFLQQNRLPQQPQQIDQLPNVSIPGKQMATITGPQQQLQDLSTQQKQQMINQAGSLSQTQNNLLQPQLVMQAQVQQQHEQHSTIQNNQTLQINHQNKSQLSQPLLLQQYNHQKLQQQQPQHQHLQRQQLQQSPQPQQPPLQTQQLQQQSSQKLQLQQLQQQQEQQHSRMPIQLPTQANQHLQFSDQQIQLQMLQKLQQQQQQPLPTLLRQLSMQQSQLPQIPETPKTLLDVPRQLSNSNSHIQQTILQKQCGKPALKLPQTLPSQSQQKILQQQVLLTELPGSILPVTSTVNIIPACGSSGMATSGAQSGCMDNFPSCSTSSLVNNDVLPQLVLNKMEHCNVMPTEKTSQSVITMLSASSFDAAGANDSLTKEQPKDMNILKPILPPKMQDPAIVAPQTYINNTGQMDYLDTTSSETSVCLSQTDGSLQQNFTLPSFNQPSLFRDVASDSDVQGTDPRNNVLFGVNIDGPIDIPLTTDTFMVNIIHSGKYHDHLNGNFVASFGNSEDAQQDLLSSMVSKSFGVPDIAFNSVSSTINESSFLNRSSWAPTPPLQRMRTYTKVYKRGAVGRSIDITRYVGYDDLKHDLARMFSIEGQLEDRQRIGSKLVYVDHENDVLLVGDDPWEEFVNCVRCIRILSPQEVQQMSLDGDLEANNTSKPYL